MSIFRGTGGSIDGVVTATTIPVAVSQGGTGATTKDEAVKNLLPDQGPKAGQYLKTDGTNTSWDEIDLGTADVKGFLPVAKGGTGASNPTEARLNLETAKSGDNTDLTSITGLTGGLSTVDYIDVDTAAGVVSTVARMSWNDTDGTLDLGLKGGNVTLQVGQELVQRVTNTTGSALTDGQVVYVTGAQGNRVTVGLAQATSDSVSATILGVVTEPIADNQQGFITTEGLVRNIDTSAFNEGDVLWLSASTAGGITNVKPTAPNHLVMIGYCVRSHASVGSIFVKTQNGYEISELHDVYINSVANNDVLVYDSADQRWENKAQSTLSVGSATTATNVSGTVAVANGGTGATTAANARTNLLPSYTGNANKVLSVTADGTDVEWSSSSGSGTVTSVAMSVPTGLDVSGSPITSTGTLAVTYSAGYSIPTDANQSNWNTAYGWGNHASAGYAADSAVVKLTGDQTVAGTKTFSSTITGSVSGNAGTVTNGVYTTGDQTIGGNKTFSSTITGSITGNAGTVTNGVVTTGSYADPAWITSIAGSKVSGNISGNAGTATALATGRTISATGDVSYTSGSFDGTGNVTGTATLATVNSNVGSFGSSSSIPVVTVNAKGLVTAVSTATVAGGQYFGTAATKAIAYNSNTIAENITITSGNNAMSVGNITISSGFSVTVQSGCRWVVL